jgi:hypothetical protein
MCQVPEALVAGLGVTLAAAGSSTTRCSLALALRHPVRAAGPEAVRVHWPGPERSPDVVLRLAQSPGGWRTT